MRASTGRYTYLVYNAGQFDEVQYAGDGHVYGYHGRPRAMRHVERADQQEGEGDDRQTIVEDDPHPYTYSARTQGGLVHMWRCSRRTRIARGENVDAQIAHKVDGARRARVDVDQSIEYASIARYCTREYLRVLVDTCTQGGGHTHVVRRV